MIINYELWVKDWNQISQSLAWVLPSSSAMSLNCIVAHDKVNYLKNYVGNLLKVNADLYGTELKERVINDIIEVKSE